MPRVALGGVRRSSAWFDGYEKTYVERDVRQLSQIADLVSFRKVVRLAALRTGKILKISELARDAQISVPTLTRYLGVMETSCIMQRIPPYLDNPAARLAGVKDVSPASDELLRGAIIETYVSGLRAFLSLMPQCRAAILAHGGTTAVSLGDRLFAVPMDVVIG